MIMMMMSSPVPDLFSVGSESALFFITEMCLCRDEADITEKGPAGDSTGAVSYTHLTLPTTAEV